MSNKPSKPNTAPEVKPETKATVPEVKLTGNEGNDTAGGDDSLAGATDEDAFKDVDSSSGNSGKRGENPAIMHLDELPFQSIEKQAEGAVVTSASAPVGELVSLDEVAAVEEKKSPKAKNFWSPTIQGLLDQLEQQGDTNALHVFEGIKSFMQNTAEGLKVDTAAGVRLTDGLYRDLQVLFTGDIKNFKLAYATVLALFFEQRSGVLGPIYVNRWTVGGADSETINFRLLMNLIMVTCEVSSRVASVKHLDMGKTLAHPYYGEVGRMRIKDFYGH